MESDDELLDRLEALCELRDSVSEEIKHVEYELWTRENKQEREKIAAGMQEMFDAKKQEDQAVAELMNDFDERYERWLAE